ncbi:hypothetical protein EV424DRAFT_894651 [Suillus variegatus]|nr:hypothetical protein EV424DRAFT_894651 [Suillus variegatus]
MSLVTSGIPLGGIIHPIMLNHLLNGAVGFERGVRASAGFVSALLLIACLSVRTRELPAPTVSYTVVARKCSREVLFVLMTVGATLFQIGFYFPMFYLQLDSTKHGIDVDFSFYSLSILNAASFIGRCTAGIIATYAGVLNFTIVSTLACSAIIISMIALSDMASVVLLGLEYGYFSGVCMCHPAACVIPGVDVPRHRADSSIDDCIIKICPSYTYFIFSFTYTITLSTMRHTRSPLILRLNQRINSSPRRIISLSLSTQD